MTHDQMRNCLLIYTAKKNEFLNIQMGRFIYLISDIKKLPNNPENKYREIMQIQIDTLEDFITGYLLYYYPDTIQHLLQNFNGIKDYFINHDLDPYHPIL